MKLIYKSKLVTKKTNYKKQRKKKKDNLPSCTGGVGVSAPCEREEVQGILSFTRQSSTCRSSPPLSSPVCHRSGSGGLRGSFGMSPLPVALVTALLSLPPITTLRAVAHGRGLGHCWSWWLPSWSVVVLLGHVVSPPPSRPMSRGSWQWWGWVRGCQLSSSIVKSPPKIILVSNKEMKRSKTYLWPKGRRRLLGLFCFASLPCSSSSPSSSPSPPVSLLFVPLSVPHCRPVSKLLPVSTP
jgi:hypothetical protein